MAAWQQGAEVEVMSFYWYLSLNVSKFILTVIVVSYIEMGTSVVQNLDRKN